MSEPFEINPKHQAEYSKAVIAAKLAERETGFWSSLLIAEWIIASKWGKSQRSNNPFKTRYAPHVHRWGYYEERGREFVLKPDLAEFLQEHAGAKVADARLNGAILEVEADLRYAAYPSLTEAFIDRARLYQFTAPYCFVLKQCKDQVSPMGFVNAISGADEHGEHRAQRIARIIEGLALAGAETNPENQHGEKAEGISNRA